MEHFETHREETSKQMKAKASKELNRLVIPVSTITVENGRLKKRDAHSCIPFNFQPSICFTAQ
jgi:hypothetical protein